MNNDDDVSPRPKSSQKTSGSSISKPPFDINRESYSSSHSSTSIKIETITT